MRTLGCLHQLVYKHLWLYDSTYMLINIVLMFRWRAKLAQEIKQLTDDKQASRDRSASAAREVANVFVRLETAA